MDFRRVAIFKEQTIRDALKKMDEERSQFLVVLGVKDELLGVVTDGDIRRSMLRGESLSSAVTEVMNSSPTCVNEETAIEIDQLAAMMNLRKIRAVPVVDDGNRVLRVITEEELLSREPLNLTALIMAGGKGERLRPLTNSIPKPLLRIGTYSLIEKLLYGLAKQKIRNIFIAVHYQKDLFFETLGNGERFGVNIEYLIEPEPMGTAGAITMLPNPSEIENLLVTNADLIHNIDYAQMLRFHLSESSDMTVASTFFSTEIPYGVLKSQDRDLIKIEEKPTFNFPIMCGVNIISNRILREYRSTTKLNMVEVIERAIASKRKVKIYDIDTYWVDIGDRGTFDRELSYFENGLPNK